LETIFLGLTGRSDPTPRLSIYRVAGRCLAVDRPVRELEPFCMPAADAAVSVRSNHALRRAADNGKLIYDDEAWVGAATRRVRSWCDGASYEIRIAGIGSFSVSVDGCEINLLDKADCLDDMVIIEAALGPALLLALAIRGVFCLHASAVKLCDGAVLFLGESAAGKSTLAEMLEDHGAGLIRVTDDISPLKYGKDRFELLPDFPQLKLTATQQYVGRNQTSSLTVKAIYGLNRVPSGKTEDTRVFRQQLGPVDSFTKLVGQSVASRLFDNDLLSRHTHQIAKLTNLVPVYELTYPSGTMHLDSVREFVVDTLR
jgi:hypothetical protein